LFLENVIPNLVALWSSKFKQFDDGNQRDEFVISPEVWNEIGKETAAAVEHIPSAFVHVLSNIATADQALFTAELWCF